MAVSLFWNSTRPVLCRSNAILFYLSQGTEFSQTVLEQVLQWLFLSSIVMSPTLLLPGFGFPYLGKADEYRDALNQKREPGYAALKVMEKHLTDHTFFLLESATPLLILVAYTHVAPEGGFDNKISKFRRG